MSTLNFLPERIASRLPRELGDQARRLDRELTRRLAAPIAAGATAAKSGLYLAESIPLFQLQRLLGGGIQRGPAPPPEARESLLDALRDLTQRDAENIAAGLYPLSVLGPEVSPVTHVSRYVRLLADSVGVAERKREKKPREFKGRAAEFARELPAYYRRNFHFQTDGYLSASSAELYEHQVEILFRGLADAMRRAIVPPLVRHAGKSRGRGMRILELGSGCGTATRFVTQALPEANLTCVDLSHPYLRAARERLRGIDRIDFLQGDAADLDLREQRFDAVFSVFLFHELPRRERVRVLAEIHRVLKPGGIHVMADSLQKGDVPELDWALDAFPRQFHEPYFRDYARNPMETLLDEAGFAPPKRETAFLTKVLAGVR